MNYYNDIDAGACEWLRNLVAAGLIPQGVVSGESIADTKADTLADYRQCHFFCGIAGWPLALQLAGWPADRPVWTGSCPCQPFSTAGARRGTADEKHLWPAFARLIDQRRPSVVFGEQVASRPGRAWLAGVRADLEAMGYAVGAADLCAGGAGEVGEGWVRRGGQVFAEPVVVGAPHVRQRLYWVAHLPGGGAWDIQGQGAGRQGGRVDVEPAVEVRPDGTVNRRGGDGSPGPLPDRWRPAWSSFDVGIGLDGKARRVESGSVALADGVPGKLGWRESGVGGLDANEAARNFQTRLRGYGNAIVPPLAAEFVRAFLDAEAVGFRQDG